MTWFDDALASIAPGLAAETGLKALTETARSCLRVADTRLLQGSCDLDTELRAARPAEPRWDYALAYDGEAWFVELHPASSSSNVDEVVAKARWLRALPGAESLHGRSRGLWWISTGAITRGPAFSRKRRQLAQNGVFGPLRVLPIPR